MNVFQFFIICKRTNNANNATHYVKLGKKRQERSKRNYYIISPRVIIKAIIIIMSHASSVACSRDTQSRDCFVGALQVAPQGLLGPISAGWIGRLIPDLPWTHGSLFPFLNNATIYWSSYAVDSHVFLPFECLHHCQSEFCQSCVQRRDPCWLDCSRRS